MELSKIKILEGTDAKERKVRRVNKPHEDIVKYLLTHDFSKWIEEHKEFIKQMQNAPYDTYITLKNRLKLEGNMASFPEFGGVVAYLIKAIFQDGKIYKYFQESEDRRVHLELVCHKLTGIMTNSRYVFPYTTTIYAIESLLILLETYYRNINQSLPNFYHNFRYRTYLDYITITACPNNIVIPTFVPTGATFFIKMRCVPLLVLGVADKPTHADQYINTPIDFWAHDVQHARRQIQETEAYFDRFVKHSAYYTKRDPFNVMEPEVFYKHMHTFTKSVILPMIISNLSDSEEAKARSRMNKIIVFEVVHEKAWPITRKALCRCIPLLYDLFPVESLKYTNGDYIDINTETFNDPTTLSNIRGKLRHGFYDDVDTTVDVIVPKKYRTSKFIAECASYILKQLNCNYIPSDELLLKLTKDETNAGEFSQVTAINIPDVPSGNMPDYTESERIELDTKDSYEPKQMANLFNDFKSTAKTAKAFNNTLRSSNSKKSIKSSLRKIRYNTV
jgi:hypothetical protein